MSSVNHHRGMQADEERRTDPAQPLLPTTKSISWKVRAIISVAAHYGHVPRHIKFPIRLVTLMTRFSGPKPIVIFNRSSQLSSEVIKSRICGLFSTQNEMRLNVKGIGMNWN